MVDTRPMEMAASTPRRKVKNPMGTRRDLVNGIFTGLIVERCGGSEGQVDLGRPTCKIRGLGVSLETDKEMEANRRRQRQMPQLIVSLVVRFGDEETKQRGYQIAEQPGQDQRAGFECFCISSWSISALVQYGGSQRHHNTESCREHSVVDGLESWMDYGTLRYSTSISGREERRATLCCAAREASANTEWAEFCKEGRIKGPGSGSALHGHPDANFSAESIQTRIGV